MNNFDFTTASHPQEATKAVSRQGAVFVAGGTNLLDLMKYQVTKADLLVDINQMANASQIEKLPNGGLRLGALATNADTAYHPLVEAQYPLLSKAILAGASAQIRNMATNGGNLLQRTRCPYFYDIHTPCNKREPGTGCSAREGYNRMMAILGTSDYCIAVFPSDMCMALAALNAVVNITGARGERSLPFAEFHRLPGNTPHLDNHLEHGEVITSIDLPPKGFAQHYSYLKLRDRTSYAFALVSVATGFELEGDIIQETRLALGGVAHKPWRVPEAEEYLVGRTATEMHFSTAAEILLQGAVGFAHNSFKIPLARKAIIRNCMMALEPASQMPGAQPSR